MVPEYGPLNGDPFYALVYPTKPKAPYFRTRFKKAGTRSRDYPITMSSPYKALKPTFCRLPKVRIEEPTKK